mmetsp:Transcript_100524/g.255758  ORF Transcript_100524/g.255758 Transcript_100524/m.255758 type:complete len:243 (+) Transcript_100524:178-906(+)
MVRREGRGPGRGPDEDLVARIENEGRVLLEGLARQGHLPLLHVAAPQRLRDLKKFRRPRRHRRRVRVDVGQPREQGLESARLVALELTTFRRLRAQVVAQLHGLEGRGPELVQDAPAADPIEDVVFQVAVAAVGGRLKNDVGIGAGKTAVLLLGPEHNLRMLDAPDQQPWLAQCSPRPRFLPAGHPERRRLLGQALTRRARLLCRRRRAAAAAAAVAHGFLQGTAHTCPCALTAGRLIGQWA